MIHPSLVIKLIILLVHYRASKGIPLAPRQAFATSGITYKGFLAAPRKVHITGGGTSYIDDSIELRLGTLLQVAETLGSQRLAAVAVDGVEKLLADWEREGVEITDGVSLLSKVSTSKLRFSAMADWFAAYPPRPPWTVSFVIFASLDTLANNGWCYSVVTLDGQPVEANHVADITAAKRAAASVLARL